MGETLPSWKKKRRKPADVSFVSKLLPRFGRRGGGLVTIARKSGEDCGFPFRIQAQRESVIAIGEHARVQRKVAGRHDQEIERRALTYFESARSEGSLLSDDALMAEARDLAERDVKRTEALADEEIDLEEEP